MYKSHSVIHIFGGIAQLARAPALQAGGRRFESDYLHHLRLFFAISSILWKYSSVGQSTTLIRWGSMVRVHLFPPPLTRVLRSCFSFPLQTHTHTKLLVCVFAVRQIIWVPCQKNFCFSQCTNILPLSITSNLIWCILRWGSVVRVHSIQPNLRANFALIFLSKKWLKPSNFGHFRAFTKILILTNLCALKSKILL